MVFNRTFPSQCAMETERNWEYKSTGNEKEEDAIKKEVRLYVRHPTYSVCTIVFSHSGFNQIVTHLYKKVVKGWQNI